MEEQIATLTAENVRMKQEIDEISDDLEMAANFGKSLLESNKEYEAKLEEMSDDYAGAVTKIEELKQENHTLRYRIESECRAKENHTFELQSLKDRLSNEFENEAKATQMTTDKKLKQLRLEIESLQSETSKHALVETQLQEKIKQQEELLEKAHKYNEQLQSKVHLESEVEEQRNLCSQLKCERDSLMLKLSDMNHSQERLAFDNKAVRQKLEMLEEEFQEKTRQSQAWFDCLQEARQETGELKSELDALKAEQDSRNYKEKGNSLFGEVEDRRLELERNYVGLQAQHECLQKTYSVTKQHLHRLKNQVATLLQVKGCHADASQIQRLRQALAQKEGEVKMLNEKISSLEKQQVENNPSARLQEFHDAFSDFGDKKDYVKFLEMQLQDAKAATGNLKKEIQTKTLMYLSESDKLRHTERQLHNAESTAERLNSENMKLKLRIDDLKMKLQTDSRRARKPGDDASNTSQDAKATRALGKSQSTGSIFHDRASLQAVQRAGDPHNLSVGTDPRSRDSGKMTAPDKTWNTTQVSKDSKSMTKSKSTGSMLKTTTIQSRDILGLPANLQQKPADGLSGARNGPPAAQPKPVQKVGPFTGTKKSVSFEPQADRAAGEGAKQGEGVAHEADASVKENADPESCEVHHVSSVATSEPASARKAPAGVKGQRHAPTVIHVGKGAGKNECAQQ